MQFQSPSDVQAVPAVIADPEPVVPELAGAGDDATGDDAPTDGVDAAAGADAGELGAEATGVEAAWEADEPGVVPKNTPPGTLVLVAIGADVVVALLPAGAAVAAALAERQAAGSELVGRRAVVPRVSTESPGLGKTTSKDSGV